MKDAFGVEITKGLPSYVKGVQLGKIKPSTNATGLSRVYRANLIRANAAGKKAAAMKPDNMKRRLVSEIPKSFSMRNIPRERFQAQVEEGQRLKRRLPGYLRLNKDLKAARQKIITRSDSPYLDENRMSAQDLIWHKATNMAPRRRNVSKAFTPRNPDFSMQAPSKPPKPVQGTLFDIGKTKPIKNT
jgi:hypothetical protein